MKLIYIDAVRDVPAGGLYDILCRNTDEALKYIRKEYKAGNTTFFIDMPGEDITLLRELTTMRNSGRMKHIKVKRHYHTDIRNMNFVEENKKWVEYYD